MPIGGASATMGGTRVFALSAV
eukprot:SAG11_NODE_51319_length_110_cov_167.727273_1_plen_21_part_01